MIESDIAVIDPMALVSERLADPKKLERLTAKGGPGLVNERAELRSFDGPENFASTKVSNNFCARFRPLDEDDDSVMKYYRMNPVFERFQILFPERLADLEQKEEDFELSGADEGADIPGYNEAAYEAYRLMSLLVDKNDPDVINHRGQANLDYLIT